MPATSWLPAPSRAARGDVRSYHHAGINIFFGRLALWHFLMEDGTRSWDGDKGRMQDGQGWLLALMEQHLWGSFVFSFLGCLTGIVVFGGYFNQ